MATFTNTFSINGVIDTNSTVFQNLQEICSAAGAWLTYDTTQGKWAAIINNTGSSTKSFNDSNIIGGINISSTGLTELYNSVEIEYPHRDLKDRKDYITFDVSAGDLYPNEPANKLQIRSELINNPVQAQLIASRELKQSRVDKVIEFRTDFSSIGLRAGDLIDVTNTALGFTNKVFRVIRIVEEDADDGSIQLSVSALEYDSAVYDTAGLVYSEKSIDSGIITKSNNTAVKAKDGESAGNDLTSALLGVGGAALLTALLNGFTKSGPATTGTGQYTGVGIQPTVYAFNTGILNFPLSLTPNVLNLGYSTVLPYTGIYKCKYNINWGGSGSPGVNGVLKNSYMIARTGGVDVGFGPGNFTGDTNVQLYEDHFLEEVFIGTAGQQVDFFFGYATDWPDAIGLINGELSLIQRTA